VVRFH